MIRFRKRPRHVGKALHIAIPGLSFSIPYLASAGAYLDGIMTGNADKITVSLVRRPHRQLDPLGSAGRSKLRPLPWPLPPDNPPIGPPRKPGP